MFTFTVIRTTKDMVEGFADLREHIDKTLQRSAFQNVKLSEIFRRMVPTQHKTTTGLALTA